MKGLINCFLFTGLIFLIACTDQNLTYQEIKKYTHLKENLYADDAGNLYLKSVNNEDIDNKHNAWIHIAYCEHCHKHKENGWRDLKELIDLPTFRLDTILAEELVYIYSDKNYRYRHKLMADGGVISVEKK